ncbi:MAG: alpha-ketoglutarate-dependent dioxygenase AlkB [Planctomycetes bacterium]|nr:alpha-ketoglutarate-dependent dioxygenase AlkB [Planctomycetota bacterium]
MQLRPYVQKSTCCILRGITIQISWGYHSARDIQENTYLTNIVEELQQLLPDYKFNSVMVTKYDSPESYIPPHSDDEECIVTDSHIITVSLGDTREIVFRRKPPCDYSREVLVATHGSVYSMSRESQEYWDHSVPKVKSEEYGGIRLSLTFRLLRQPGLKARSSHGNVDPPPSTQTSPSLDSPVVLQPAECSICQTLRTHHSIARCSESLSSRFVRTYFI